MRLVALDASVDDLRCERALGTALSRSPDRLFLFGEAATVAVRRAERDVAARDQRFLDVAAEWAVASASAHGSVDEVPSRAGLPVPLLEVAVVVSADDYLGGHDARRVGLTCTKRAVEMLGHALCIAAPEEPALDEVDNAVLWICGGNGAFHVGHVKGKTVVAPGDVLADGYIAVVDVNGGDLVITRVDVDGNTVDAQNATVTAASRISVQG